MDAEEQTRLKAMKEGWLDGQAPDEIVWLISQVESAQATIAEKDVEAKRFAAMYQETYEENYGLESQLCAAREGLEGLEYVQGSVEGEPRYCPWCETYEPGHREDCQRQQALTHTGPCKHEAEVERLKLESKATMDLSLEVNTYNREIEADNELLRTALGELQKLAKSILENGSSQAFFIAQQAYGDLGWDEVVKKLTALANLSTKEEE